jgi:hypothetical protein
MVIIILLYVLTKKDLSGIKYIIFLMILMTELYFVVVEYTYNLNKDQTNEHYAELPKTSAPQPTVTSTELNTTTTDEPTKFTPLDTESISKLQKLPQKVSTNINSGIQDLIDSTKGDIDTTTLLPENKKYKDENIRKIYKHIDYFLEKVKIFDKNIYNVIVPTYSKTEIEKMKEDDNNLLTEPTPPSCK